MALPNAKFALPGPDTTPLVADNTSQYVPLNLQSSTPVTSWGASGSGATFTGRMSAGSQFLTITAGTLPSQIQDFQPGQGILIAGAGSGGTDLVTIVQDSNGPKIRTVDAGVTTVTSAVVMHDETHAIQLAINASFDAGGAVILFPDGIYNINGPFTDFNSILKIPFQPGFPGNVALPTVPIWFVGNAQPFPGFASAPSQAGVIIRTNRIGVDSNSCMIAASVWTPGTAIVTSNTTVYMSNITWRTYSNPQISGVDMGMAGNAIFNNVAIDTGLSMQDTDLVEPTHGGFGLRTPRVNAGSTANAFDQVFVLGYGTGIIFAEQFRSTWFAVFACKIGMSCAFSYHPAWGEGLIWHCPQWIVFNDRQSVDFSLDVEYVVSGWNAATLGNDFVDPGNLATGIIKYSKILGGVGTATLASNTGMGNCSLYNLNGLGNQIAGPITFDSLSVTDLTVTGDFTLDGETVSFGANNSAAAAGFREVQVPNTGAGERFTLWNGGAGREAPLPGSLTTGLVSFWNCNDATGAGAVDSQGTNNLGDVGTCPSVAGHISTAIGFNGTSQYETITNGAQTGLSPGASDFTISTWVFLTDKTANHYIITKSGATSGTDEYILQYDNPSDRIQWVTQFGAVYTILPANSFGSPPANTWFLVIAWFDNSTGTMSIQCDNGAVDSSSAGIHAPVQGAGNFFLGSYDGTLFMQGRLDATGFWSRILTA
jgi:hypothetical protein